MVTVVRRTAEFRFFHPFANCVYLAGDFNAWQADELPMTLGPDGYWRGTLLLPAGVFRFRYRADGQWFTDYAADGLVPNLYGEFNSLLHVPESKAAKSRGRKTQAQA